MHRLIAAQLFTIEIMRFFIGIQTRTEWAPVAGAGTYDHIHMEWVKGILAVSILADGVEIGSCTWGRNGKKVEMLNFTTIDDLPVAFPEDLMNVLISAAEGFGVDELVLSTNLLRSGDSGALEVSFRGIGNTYQEYQILRGLNGIAFRIPRSSAVYNKSVRAATATR